MGDYIICMYEMRGFFGASLGRLKRYPYISPKQRGAYIRNVLIITHSNYSKSHYFVHVPHSVSSIPLFFWFAQEIYSSTCTQLPSPSESA